MLPKIAIDEFKKIYKGQVKQDLNDIQAPRLADSLFNLFKSIYLEADTNESKKQNYESNTNHHNKRISNS